MWRWLCALTILTLPISSAASLAERISRIKSELGIDSSASLKEAVREAHTILGTEAHGTLIEQVSTLEWEILGELDASDDEPSASGDETTASAKSDGGDGTHGGMHGGGTGSGGGPTASGNSGPEIESFDSHGDGLRPTVIEVVLSFDTTGSMYSWLEQTRKGLQSLIRSLVANTKAHDVALQIGVIAHGDYSDAGSTYVIKHLPLAPVDSEEAALIDLLQFVTSVEPTNGGDAPECYELALNYAHERMGWTPGSRRILVMVGDSLPHAFDDNERLRLPGAFDKDEDKDGRLPAPGWLNWRNELQHLIDKRVKVYAVQANGGGGGRAHDFWWTLGSASGGAYLPLTSMASLAGVSESHRIRTPVPLSSTES